MLTDPSVIETLKARSAVIKTMRKFFEKKSFLEVQTPIMTGLAGGAIARPFETTATEFPHRDLSLRIAPELWLKRLIVGGMERIFEIGPCFRNEGLDKTHNAEFTTCEFYAVKHDMSQLIAYTQDLLVDLASAVESLGYPLEPKNPAWLQYIKEKRYLVLDFLPTLSNLLGQALPALDSPTSKRDLLDIFTSKSLSIPPNPTTPRLLDKLCSIYLEPQSLNQPTWIIGIPSCLSPLAKSQMHHNSSSFSYPGVQQEVGLRAELFIDGKEVVNCYEEENSPFEQRRKFLEQQRYARQSSQLSPNSSDEANPVIDDEVMPVDESYLRALEWGLPPTGGWGCGIDRLVMLFTGRERISDVLSFGNLRHVTRAAETGEKGNS